MPKLPPLSLKDTVRFVIPPSTQVEDLFPHEFPAEQRPAVDAVGVLTDLFGSGSQPGFFTVEFTEGVSTFIRSDALVCVEEALAA